MVASSVLMLAPPAGRVGVCVHLAELRAERLTVDPQSAAGILDGQALEALVEARELGESGGPFLRHRAAPALLVVSWVLPVRVLYVMT